MEAPSTAPPSVPHSDHPSHTSVIEVEDRLRRALKLITPQSDRRVAHGAHPSQGGLIRTPPDIDLRRRFPPVTCSACRVTYLAGVELPELAPVADWVCPLCLGESVSDARRGAGEIEATEQPPE